MSSTDETIGKIFLDEINELAAERGETLDKAFSSWIVSSVLDKTENSEIDEIVEIGHSGDYGIDFFDINEDPDEESIITFGQAKFSTTLDKEVTREELETFLLSRGRLETPPLSANETFKKKAKEFQQCVGRYRVRMIYAVTGELNTQAKNLLNDPIERQKFVDPDATIEIYDLPKILAQIQTLETLPLSIKFDGTVLQRIDIATGKPSLHGFVKGKEIIKTYENNKARIFLENPRESLGTTSTNKEIATTLKDSVKKSKFWKLNNGITAVCRTLKESETEANTWQFDNFKVVNGRQTTFSLWDNKGYVDDTVLVSLTVHTAPTEEERNDISASTNTQNPIKPADLVTNYPEIKKLFIEFQRIPGWYFERQRGAFKLLDKANKTKITKRRVIEKAKGARLYKAFHQMPFEAVKSGEKDIFITDYDSIFKDRKPIDFILPHIFYKLLEELTLYWKKEPSKLIQYSYLRLSVVQYYILSFLADSFNDISSPDKEKVEQKIIDLFSKIKKNDSIPKSLLEISESAFNSFLQSLYVFSGKTTWEDKEMKEKLLERKNLISDLINTKKINAGYLGSDPIKDKLLAL